MSLRRTAAADDTDAELAARVRAGDQEAFRVVYGRLAGGCLGLARRILVDEGLAQDVVQEVFIGYWRDRDRYEPGRGRLSSYLLTLTHHRAVDTVRREQAHRRRRAPLEALGERAGSADTFEAADRSVRAGITLRALAELTPPQREVLSLAYYDGLSQSEVADRLGIPLGTVKSRTLTGLRRLRELLDAHGLDHLEGAS